MNACFKDNRNAHRYCRLSRSRETRVVVRKLVLLRVRSALERQGSSHAHRVFSEQINRIAVFAERTYTMMLSSRKHFHVFLQSFLFMILLISVSASAQQAEP